MNRSADFAAVSTSGHISTIDILDRAKNAIEKHLTKPQQIHKAAFTSTDLSSGGLLLERQARDFIELLRIQPTILRSARFLPMKSLSQRFDRIGFTGRIFHKGVENTGLSGGDQAKPTMSKIQMNAKEFVAEIEITYDALEDSLKGEGQIHGNDFVKIVLKLAAAQGALDAEEFALLSDTGSGDNDLDQFDGWLKVAAANNTYDHLGAPVSKALFFNSKLALPKQYRQRMNGLRFYAANDVEAHWQDEIADRITTVGDMFLVDGFQGTLKPYSIPIIPNGTIPTDETPGDNSRMLLTHHNNLMFGIWRDIHLDVDKDVRKRHLVFVLSMRIDAKMAQPEGSVAAINIKVA